MLALALASFISQAPAAEGALLPRMQVLDQLTAIEAAWPSAKPPAIALGLSGASSVLGLALILTDTFRGCSGILGLDCRFGRGTLMKDVGLVVLGAGLVGLAVTGVIFARLRVIRSRFRVLHQALSDRIDQLDHARADSAEDVEEITTSCSACSSSCGPEARRAP